MALDPAIPFGLPGLLTDLQRRLSAVEATALRLPRFFHWVDLAVTAPALYDLHTSLPDTYPALSVRRHFGGLIQLRGALGSLSLAGETVVVTTLPPEYRPGFALQLPAIEMVTRTLAIISVNTNGTIGVEVGAFASSRNINMSLVMPN